MSGPDEPWSILRALRASPPGRAETDEARRAVFTAALEQAEQFLAAAAVVGYATKPVQLFYALSQAGRAIAAAHADEPWEIQGHGAKVMTRERVSTTSVEPRLGTKGALGLVARATGSELWEGRVTVAALWASLPELRQPEALIGSEHPPLRVTVQQTGIPFGRYGIRATRLATRLAVSVKERPTDPELRRALVERIMAPYPKAAGWVIVDKWVTITDTPSSTPRILLEWQTADADGNRVVIAPELLTEHYDGAHYFRPGLGKARVIPSHLITWWGLLLALSSLARYEPAVWRRALDIDNSPLAWALESGLRIAEERIPELVLQAVTGQMARAIP